MPIDPTRMADKDHPAASAVLLEVRKLIITLGGILLLLAVVVGVIEWQILNQRDNITANARAAEDNAKANNKTREVAERIDHTLTSVIAEARANAENPATVRAQREARERIEKIELAVCGGPCPELQTTSTTPTTPGSEGD